MHIHGSVSLEWVLDVTDRSAAMRFQDYELVIPPLEAKSEASSPQQVVKSDTRSARAHRGCTRCRGIEKVQEGLPDPQVGAVQIFPNLVRPAQRDGLGDQDWYRLRWCPSLTYLAPSSCPVQLGS